MGRTCEGCVDRSLIAKCPGVAKIIGCLIVHWHAADFASRINISGEDFVVDMDQACSGLGLSERFGNHNRNLIAHMAYLAVGK